MLPALFSAMEAILVPETSSALKAGVVTVRSVAVHIALDKEFFSPDEIMLGYALRSDLVHGTPTSGVPDKEATDFAESRRYWAYTVFRDYLKLAKVTEAAEVADIVCYLDREHCEKRAPGSKNTADRRSLPSTGSQWHLKRSQLTRGEMHHNL